MSPDHANVLAHPPRNVIPHPPSTVPWKEKRATVRPLSSAWFSRQPKSRYGPRTSRLALYVLPSASHATPEVSCCNRRIITFVSRTLNIYTEIRRYACVEGQRKDSDERS